MNTASWLQGTANLGRFVAVLVVMLILSLVAQRTSAQPPLPATFYGTVQLDGTNVPDGTPISAWIKGQQYAQAETLAYQGNSVYTIDVPGDDPDTPGDIEGGTAGDEVSFKVGGQVAIATGIWEQSSLNNLNLVACTLIGDMDCNGSVDVNDIMKVATCWRDVNRLICDLDDDGDCDIADIQGVAARWGDESP